MMTTRIAPSHLGFDEKIEYLHPTVHYETDAIAELYQLVSQALEGEDVFEALEDHVQSMAEFYEDFDCRHIRPFLSALAEDAANAPNDPFPHQLTYALETGSRLFERGRAALQEFIDSDSDDHEEFERAIQDLGDGHDYIYFGIELVQSEIRAMDSSGPSTL